MSGVAALRHELRVLLVVGPPVVALQDVVAAGRAAVAGGATALQLRMKSGGAGAMLALARELVRAVPVPVWVNDRADVALAAAARGVHVGQDDIPPAAVRAFAGERLRIGLSAGTPAEAAVARAASVDYWSIGSVFATETKPDAGAPIGVAGFGALAASAPAGMPVLAIGGITPERVAELVAAGACGVAVSSAVLAAGDIVLAARRLRDAVDAAVAPDR